MTVDSRALKSHKEVDHQDPVALGQHRWGFLNVNLTGDAYEVSGDIPTGIDAYEQLKLLEEVMEDRFAMLDIQVESLAGGCPCTDGRCPCACSKSAPMREPPKRKAEAGKAESEDGWEDDKKDPWKAFAKKRPGGGPEGGGGPGGGGGEPGG